MNAYLLAPATVPGGASGSITSDEGRGAAEGETGGKQDISQNVPRSPDEQRCRSNSLLYYYLLLHAFLGTEGKKCTMSRGGGGH